MCSVSCSVTLAAQADQVVRVERDARVVDVVRCDLSDVVHVLRGCVLAFSQAILTQPAVTLHDVVSQRFPLFGFVEGSGEVSHVLVSLFV